VGNGLDRHAIVVSLKGRTQNRRFLMRLQSSETLVGLDHAGRDPSQGHTGIPPAFDVARDPANGALKWTPVLGREARLEKGRSV
jgi:hypothetical protein